MFHMPEAVLIGHLYWVRREAFMLAQDVYPCWTLFAVEQGKFNYSIGDRQGYAGVGSLVLCPPGITFYRSVLETLTFHFIQFDWTNDPPPAELTTLIGELSMGDPDRLFNTLTYLRHTLDKDEASKRRKQHLLNDMLLMTEWKKEVFPIQGHENQRIAEARRLLIEQAFSPLRMNEIALAAGLTPVQLTRGFQAAFGQTPTNWLTELRLAKARQLLEQTTATLEQIAPQCGYENGFYLSRIFTRKMGMAPSVYRKKYQV